MMFKPHVHSAEINSLYSCFFVRALPASLPFEEGIFTPRDFFSGYALIAIYHTVI